jgi:hypothetical protein
MEKQKNYDFRYFHLKRPELDRYELMAVEVLLRKENITTLTRNENTFIWTSTFQSLQLEEGSKLTFQFSYKSRGIDDITYISALQKTKPSKEILIKRL